MRDTILPGLPVELILAAYAAAPGNEIESGKFLSPELSAALAANTFGFFLGRPFDLPKFPIAEEWGWPANSIHLEAIVRFPWSGGRHPCLDALVETDLALIGVESKRYEPFRPKAEPELSDAYWRPVWGHAMGGYSSIRDGLRNRQLSFTRLDAAQLVKHAFALRSAVHREPHRGKKPVLLYLHAEPKAWPDGRTVSGSDTQTHREDICRFAEIVAGDEVAFHSCTYRELMSVWSLSENADIRNHVSAVSTRLLR